MMRDEYEIDEGCWSIVVRCLRCDWRTLVLSVDEARTDAEQHLIRSHYSIQEARRARETIRKRNRIRGA